MSERELTKEEILERLPVQFHSLDLKARYRLTKVASTRPNGFVTPGDTVRGELEFVQVPGTVESGIRVRNENRFNDYIRTSPVVQVIDHSSKVLTFQTQGGVYNLERLDESRI